MRLRRTAFCQKGRFEDVFSALRVDGVVNT